MNTFVSAVDNQEARTLNGMKAFKDTSNALVDLFFKAGAMRGQDIVPFFVAAYVEDKYLAARIALWMRDIRGGAGERQLFRDILNYLEVHDPELCETLLPKIQEIGRFDDYFSFKTRFMLNKGFYFVAKALTEGNKLAGKWSPRKKSSRKSEKDLIAYRFRKYLGMKDDTEYRKFLVGNTEVIESLLCSKRWGEINYSQAPSLAHIRYRKTFFKHDSERYTAYAASLVKNEENVKINAGAIYPYDVIKGYNKLSDFNKTEKDIICEQWKALPNYVGEASILPMVDVSGSMCCPISGNLTAMDVAVSLGLYLSDKNHGAFKDLFLTFSSNANLVKLRGNIIEKYEQMITSEWGMTTDLHKAFEKILTVAQSGKVSQEEMPKILLILSDMQFNMGIQFDDSAIEMIRRKYSNAGYEMPKIVFWNLNAHDNVPVKFLENGVALVSGFSPSIMKSILKADMKEFSPYNIMLNTIMDSRYDF